MIPYVVGLESGRLSSGVADGSRRVVTPPALVAGDRPTPVVRGDLSRRPLALDEFERRVQYSQEAPSDALRAAAQTAVALLMALLMAGANVDGGSAYLKFGITSTAAGRR